MEENERVITDEMLEKYKQTLANNEKSGATIQKYLADLHKLVDFSEGKAISKDLMLSYKEHLVQMNYKQSSINSYLIAANSFLSYMGWEDAKVQTIRLQHTIFYPDEKCLSKDEYRILVQKARAKGNTRLAMILNTICSTGIRISELQFITVENVRKGKAVIQCKGKIRVILICRELQNSLLSYAQDRGITAGIIFRTASGKPVDRSNIWRQMKALCAETGVGQEKVFPHNLRHLFARTYYEEGKDIAKLADVLGHSSIETTRIYIMSTCEEHRKYLEKMDLLY